MWDYVVISALLLQGIPRLLDNNEHSVLRRGLQLPRPRTESQVFVLFVLMA